jgi:hypothetical protein
MSSYHPTDIIAFLYPQSQSALSFIPMKRGATPLAAPLAGRMPVTASRYDFQGCDVRVSCQT